MAHATLLPYVGSPINSNPELPRTAEQDPVLTQGGARDQPANNGRTNQQAEACGSAIALADVLPQTMHAPKDPLTVLTQKSARN